MVIIQGENDIRVPKRESGMGSAWQQSDIDSPEKKESFDLL